MRVLSLFSGIGAFEMALRNIGVEYELVGFSEIDTNAIKSYCAIHGVDESKLLGDVSKIDANKLPDDIDLLTHGSPCQTFSVEGKKLGGNEGSGTSSSLMWETVRIIRDTLPKVVVWENVKNVLSKEHKHNFDKYIETLNDLGYKSHYRIINSMDFGLPQNRERVFCISVLDSAIDFEFPQKRGLNIQVKDLLEEKVDDKYYLKSDALEWKLIEFTQNYDVINIKQATKQGYIELKRGGVCDLNRPNSKTRRGRVQFNGTVSPTVTASVQSIYYIEEDNRVRNLTPLETWRLQGFSDDDYRIASEVCTETYLYKQSGNSISVNVLEDIFKQLYGDLIKNCPCCNSKLIIADEVYSENGFWYCENDDCDTHIVRQIKEDECI